MKKHPTARQKDLTAAKTSKKEKSIRLLSSMQNKDYSRLVVLYPYQTDDHYAGAYHFAANRLASTFGGEPVDDQLLLPFLALYRHAFELQLKNTIRSLVKLRAEYLEGWTPELTEAISEKRFRDNNQLGHNLYKLLNDAKRHFAALNLPEKFPKSVESIISKLHEADKAGTALRYAGALPTTHEYVDFPDLVELLDREFDLLSVVIDYAEGCCEYLPTKSELEDDVL